MASVHRFGSMPPLRAALAAWALLAFLAGCAQPPVPQDRYYRIEVAVPEPGPQALDGTLQVERFAAEGVFSGRPIVFTEPESPGELKEYYYDFWAEPPSVMLRDSLIAYLRDAGVAETVVTPEMRVDAEYVLNGRISRLEHVKGDEPRVAVALEIGVTDTRTNKLVYLGDYSLAVAAGDNSVPAAVQAVNQAVAEMYARALADIRKR